MAESRVYYSPFTCESSVWIRCTLEGYVWRPLRIRARSVDALERLYRFLINIPLQTSPYIFEHVHVLRAAYILLMSRTYYPEPRRI